MTPRAERAKTTARATATAGKGCRPLVQERRGKSCVFPAQFTQARPPPPKRCERSLAAGGRAGASAPAQPLFPSLRSVKPKVLGGRASRDTQIRAWARTCSTEITRRELGTARKRRMIPAPALGRLRYTSRLRRDLFCQNQKQSRALAAGARQQNTRLWERESWSWFGLLLECTNHGQTCSTTK